ncbi:MAG TPA: peptide-methionine (S)-S-oxide reductase MsrA [Gemmatimonadaceae bacterium]|nr:peptide-methionine (S)-S-oxide reductase MsrA [Gemmatimonadaceae bacterium]
MLRPMLRPIVVLAAALSLAAGGAAALAGGSPPPVIRAAVVFAGSPAALDTAVFAGGCFWGVEAVFEHVRGVADVVSGYAGGDPSKATYRQVSSGATGNAESVRVVYDPSQVSYQELLRVFFLVAHDPTQKDRQGPDVGPQYRSAIFYAGEEQREEALAAIAELERARAFKRPIATQVAPLAGFHAAEAYHQDYAAHHPNDVYIVINDRPKVERLRRDFPQLWRDRRAGG